MSLSATLSDRALFKFTVRAVFCLLLAIITACTSSLSGVADEQLIQSIRWYTGEAGKVDDEKAKALLERAASDRDPLSTMWLARVFSTGRMGYVEDKVRAQEIARTVIDEVEALADRGVPEAQFLLGTAYAESLGKNRDDAAAASWYTHAAENGHVLAAHNMGNIHFSGVGVEKDDALAVSWWTRAAEAGDAIPQFRLAQMYEQGRGVEKDLELARRWYAESASRGNRDAQDALARLDR